MPTIGFNNKTGLWTSKYSYTSACISNIDKKMYSSPTVIDPTDDVIWHQHNVGAINSFYGSATNSAIAVSFNQQPSQNKIYKSFSLEGSENLSGSVNTFETNETLESVDANQAYSIGPIRNKGGILYAYMGKDGRIKNGRVMSLIGNGNFVPASDYYEEAESTHYIFQSSAIDYSGIVDGDPKFLYNYPGVTELYHIGGGDVQTAEPTDTSAQIGSWIELITPDYAGSYITPYGLLVNAVDTTGPIQIASASNYPGSINLFVASESAGNGDFMRGQFAECYMVLPIDNFELYSLNLYYEPTTLDHSS